MSNIIRSGTFISGVRTGEGYALLPLNSDVVLGHLIYEIGLNIRHDGVRCLFYSDEGEILKVALDSEWLMVKIDRCENGLYYADWGSWTVVDTLMARFLSDHDLIPQNNSTLV